jgi:hypothetical protein
VSIVNAHQATGSWFRPAPFCILEAAIARSGGHGLSALIGRPDDPSCGCLNRDNAPSFRLHRRQKSFHH